MRRPTEMLGAGEPAEEQQEWGFSRSEPPRGSRSLVGVDNYTDNRHGIVAYLDDRAVAQRILSGLVA